MDLAIKLLDESDYKGHTIHVEQVHFLLNPNVPRLLHLFVYFMLCFMSH